MEWLRKIRRRQQTEEERRELEQRRAVILGKREELEQLLARPSPLASPSLAHPRAEEADRYPAHLLSSSQRSTSRPAHSSSENSSERSLRSQEWGAAAVQRLLDEASTASSSASVSARPALSAVDRWAPLSALKARDAEFAEDTVRLNTAANQAMLRLRPDDAVPAAARPSRLARLFARLTRSQPPAIHFHPTVSRTHIFTDELGNSIRSETFTDSIAAGLNAPLGLTHEPPFANPRPF